MEFIKENLPEVTTNDTITDVIIFEKGSNKPKRIKKTLLDSNYVSSSLEPLVYKALLVQSGTNPPTVTILKNTLGETLTWEYQEVGYYFTQSSLFTQTNMSLNIQKDYLSESTQIVVPDKRIFYDGTDAGGGYVSVQTQGNDIPANDLLDYTMIEIEVYL